MSSRLFKVLLSALALAVGVLPAVASAQSYSTIDEKLRLFCADLPDGTNALVKVVSDNGLYTFVPVDPDEETKAIVKLIKLNQKKIHTLQQIKKDNDPASDLNTVKKIYKFVSDNGFQGTQPNKVFTQISQLIKQLQKRIEELQDAIETIDRCENNEDLIPPPQPGSAEVITFAFQHPDYGDTVVMRGLGVTGTLSKKASFGTLCVGTNKPHSTLETFPNESEITIQRNPCLVFFPSAFRNYPFCGYGPKNTGVGWFSITDVGFSLSAVDDDELAALENKLAHFAPIHVRTPSKKYPCRKPKTK